MTDLPPLLFVSFAALLAPWLSAQTRSLRVPVVVFEIALGVLIGPQGLGLAGTEKSIPYLTEMGMAFLFFMAGVEIDLASMRGGPLKLATLAWLTSLGLAGLVAFGLSRVGGAADWVLVAILLSTTGLGIIVPVLKDAGLAETPLGKYAIAVGALAEIGPIVLVSLLMTEKHGFGSQLGLVILFLVVVLFVFWASLSLRPEPLVKLLRRTMTKSGQLPIRLSLFLIALLVVFAEVLGLDIALGAFAAGMAVGLALRGDHGSVLHHKFDAIGFGFLVPIFFVASGMRLDVHALTRSAANIGMMFGYALLLLVVRGLPNVVFRNVLGPRELASLGFYSATTLSLIVALTATAVDRKLMASDGAAALVGGGVLSVLLFPMIATRLAGKSNELRARPVEQETGY